MAGGVKGSAAFAAGRNGALYLANWSIAPAQNGGALTGSVVQITQS